MKRITLVLLLVLAATPLWAGSTCDRYNNCYFYGGDFSYPDRTARPFAWGLANENDAIVGGSPYGAATYQNFVASTYIGVTGLFTNNLSQLIPISGYWEIRTGVSEGNGGTLIASGSGAITNTPTGRSGFGYTEYSNAVSGLNVWLSPGTYWFAVVPSDPTHANRSFNTNTTGLNSVGSTIPNQQYFNSPFFGANFTNANNEGGGYPFPTFSSGVLTGPCDCRLAGQTVPPVPEPSSLILLGTGLVGAAATARWRWFS